MTVRPTMWCDTPGGCYLHEYGTDPDDPEWVRIDGKDYCDSHRPCPGCGHPRIEHRRESHWEDGELAVTSERYCHVGQQEVWEHSSPGRTTLDGTPLDYIVSGRSIVVDRGCGCLHSFT